MNEINSSNLNQTNRLRRIQHVTAQNIYKLVYDQVI